MILDIIIMNACCLHLYPVNLVFLAGYRLLWAKCSESEHVLWVYVSGSNDHRSLFTGRCNLFSFVCQNHTCHKQKTVGPNVIPAAWMFHMNEISVLASFWDFWFVCLCSGLYRPWHLTHTCLGSNQWLFIDYLHSLLLLIRLFSFIDYLAFSVPFAFENSAFNHWK